jgi:hypothetical protein
MQATGPWSKRVGQALRTRPVARSIELVAPFAVAVVIIALGRPIVGEDPLRYQLLVWIANIAMLALTWLGLHLRGEGWGHLGLRWRGRGLHVLPIFFVVSLGWGFIAWRANSIRPGIVAHTVIDAAAFLWAIFDLNGVKSVLAYSIADNGFTPGYRALAIATAACALATLGALAYMRQRLASQS